MKKIICALFLLVAMNVQAKPIHIKCWSANNLLYDGKFDENQIAIQDGYIIIYKGNRADILLADCIMRVEIPPRKKH